MNTRLPTSPRPDIESMVRHLYQAVCWSLFVGTTLAAGIMVAILAGMTLRVFWPA